MRQLGPFAPLLLPAAAAFTLLFVLPSLWVAWASVSEPRPGLGNYLQLLTTPGSLRIFGNTLHFAVISTGVAVTMAYVLAYAIDHAGSRQRTFLLLVLVYSLWVSALIRALAWLILLSDRGVMNTLLIDLGVATSPLRMVHNDIGVIVGMVHFLLPVCTLSLVASFRGIDRSCLLAARSLGAGPLRCFLHVFAPLSLPGVVSAISLTFVLALGFYIVPSLLGGGRRTVIAEFISAEVLDYGNWGLPAAAALLLALVTVLVVAIGARAAGATRHEAA